MSEFLGNSCENLAEKKGERVIYAAFFVDDPEELKKRYPPVHENEFYHHSIVDYRPTDGKQGIEVGKKSQLEITGRVTTRKIDSLLVRSEKSRKENPHITLSTARGVKPVVSETEIAKAIKEGRVEELKDLVKVTEGYFDGINDIKE